jgi:hypothetical protein
MTTVRYVVRQVVAALVVVLGMGGALGMTSASAQEIKQIQLTDAHITSFIQAQTDLAAIAPKLQDAGEQPDTNLQKELEVIASRHGFASFAELDDVAANISIVMSGLDEDTGEFLDPVDALKKELDDIKADASIPDDDKKQLVEELNEAIKATPPLQFKDNIEVVKKRRSDLDKALQ